MTIGECDYCSAWRPLRHVVAYGIDTAACAVCRHEGRAYHARARFRRRRRKP